MSNDLKRARDARDHARAALEAAEQKRDATLARLSRLEREVEDDRLQRVAEARAALEAEATA